MQYPGYSDAIKKRVVESAAVQQKVEELVDRRWRKLGLDEMGADGVRKKRQMEKQLIEVAEGMADKMVRLFVAAWSVTVV